MSYQRQTVSDMILYVWWCVVPLNYFCLLPPWRCGKIALRRWLMTDLAGEKILSFWTKLPGWFILGLSFWKSYKKDYLSGLFLENYLSGSISINHNNLPKIENNSTMTRSSIASNAGRPYEATIPPPLAYGGFIVSQHPHEHDDGGDLHHVLDKG